MPAGNPSLNGPERVVTEIVNGYLDEALAAIDRKFGGGSARANQALVSAYLQACATIHSSYVVGEDDKP